MNKVKPGYLLTESLMAILIVGFSLGGFLALQGTLIKLIAAATKSVENSVACKSSLYAPPQDEDREIGFEKDVKEGAPLYEITKISEKSAFKECKRCGLVKASLENTTFISFIFLAQEKQEEKEKEKK
jgi:hypothetical protein